MRPDTHMHSKTLLSELPLRSHLNARKYKLKSDTFYLSVDEGIYFRNNEKSFVMKGKTIAAWVERLAPLLDGRYNLEQLCQKVPSEKQSMIVKIVQTLAEQGYLKDVALDQPHTLSPELQETYSQAITYIDYYTDSGPFRFQRFLDLPVLAISSGDALVALAHTLLETGNRGIHLLDSGEEITDHERIKEHLDILRSARDPALGLKTVAFTAWDDDTQLQAMVAPFSMVLLFDTSGSVTLAHRLAQACDRMEVPFLPAVVLGNAIHIGPLHLPHVQGCWQCYWRRYQAAQGLSAADEHGTAMYSTLSERPDTLDLPAMAVSANLVAFEFFKQATGIHSMTLENEAYVLELERLQSVKHRVLPHPLCTVCAPQPSTTASAYEQQASEICRAVTLLQQRNSAITGNALLKQTDRWVDEVCGIFTVIDEQDYVQLPLVRSKITVASSVVPGERLPVVRAAGLDYLEARTRAVRGAIALYLDRVAVPQQAYAASYKELRKRWKVPHPSAFLGGARVLDQQELPWLWGYWLEEAQPLPVPAAAVYPRSFWNASHGEHLFSRDLPGVSVGANWSETLAQGLLALGTTVNTLEEDTVSCNNLFHAHIIEREAYTHDRVCVAYLKMLELMGHIIELLDMIGPLALPCIGAFLSGRFIGMKTHWDALVATREILQEAVLIAQIERSPAPDDSDVQEWQKQTQVLHAGCVVAAQKTKVLPPSLTAETHYREAAQIMQKRFQDRGWKLVIVPAVKDSTIDDVIGCAMHVLAVRGYE